MKLLFTTCLSACLLICNLSAQTFFQEDFEASGLPAGWTVETAATDGGWSIGTASSLSSQFFTIESNGSTRIAGTNDDLCNCNKSQDYLITPPLDLSTTLTAVMTVDIFFGKNSYQGSTESGSIEVSLDKTNWTVVKDLDGTQGWFNYTVDLSAYTGNDSVYVAFHYNDGSGWLYGMAVDNVVIEQPAVLDAALEELNTNTFGKENVAFPIAGTIFNNSVTPITALEISYSVNGGIPAPGMLGGLNIQPFTYYEFQHPTDWVPNTGGTYDLTVSIASVNGTADEVSDNNSLSFQTTIYPNVVPPNLVDEFLATAPVYETIATSANNLDKPTDLDFFPILAKNELWVINERNESDGGSTLTIYDAGTPDQSNLHRVDGNAWHFMSLPTAMAFGDNLNWANSPGVQDANHNGGTFTGPSLWSSDPAIYAQPSGGNGSHLDMLHGSPRSMGIAHEVDNVYWIFDGWNETIVRYDFQEDHGPGNDYHGDAIVRRYLEIEVKRDGVVPSHMVLDKTSGWMYIVDNGNDRVLRLDINSGQVSNSIPLINEALAEHSQVSGVTWEVIVDQNLDQPCGIEIIENRLLVGDYATGDIIVYDTDNNFVELGRIATGQAGITGIKIGPDGAIWYTNRLRNTVQKATPGDVSSSQELALTRQVKVMPNPTTGTTLLRLPEDLQANVLLTDLTGRQIQRLQNVNNNAEINLNGLPNGLYLLTIWGETFSTTRKIVLEK